MLWPDAIEKIAGVTVMDESEGAATVTPAVPETELKVAVIVTVPAFNAVSMPVPLTDATVGSELCQTAWLVSDSVLLSE